MTEVVSAVVAEHYLWGEACHGWHLVRNEGLSVIEEQMPPGSSEQRHLHRKARQFFYVLAGELTLEIEGRMHQLGVSEGIEVAPGEAHQVMNRSSEQARFLVISAPPSHGDRISE